MNCRLFRNAPVSRLKYEATNTKRYAHQRPKPRRDQGRLSVRTEPTNKRRTRGINVSL